MAEVQRVSAARLLSLGVCAALAVGGCGGGVTGRPAPPPRSGTPGTGPASPAPAPTPTAGPYRWLVPTAGAQPTVAAENRHHGTRAWRLPGPAADVGGLAHGPIAAYVASQALAPGQLQRIYAQDPRSHRVRIRVFRLGWYGGAGGREVLRSALLRLRRQPACAHDSRTGLTQCHWHPTLSFKLPPALASGVYIAQLSTDRGDRTDSLFVVMATTVTALLAQLPTSTYEAYNAWGGDSLYPGGERTVGLTHTTQGVEVSYDRPYDSVTGAGQFFSRGDFSLVRFLERYGYDASYTDSEAADRDPSLLAGHRALIDFGHSEYWSERGADAWRRARDHGTNLAFLGSDTMAWRVRFAPAGRASSEGGQPAHVMIGYKEHATLDPDRRQATGDFPAEGAPLTGSAYVGCITPRVARPGPPSYRYYGWRPSPTLQPRWFFAGTGVTASTLIPGITGYELDQVTPQSPPGTTLVGRGIAPCMTARDPGEPLPGPGPRSADTTIYRARSGALVFNTGTLGWELGLGPVPSASPDAPLAADARVVRMTRNLLKRMGV